MYTAGELRRLLAAVPDDYPVIMSKDSEGNRFSPMRYHNVHLRYIAESVYSGEIINPNDCEQGVGESPCTHTDCQYARATPVLVLWPTV